MLVLFPNPISLANFVAFIMKNLIFFLANSRLISFGILGINLSLSQIVFNRNVPPSFNPEIISYFPRYAGAEQATKPGLVTK